MNILKARSSQMQILKSHFCQLSDHHVHHLVASTEMMVERDGHAILQSAAANSLFQRAEFGLIVLLCGTWSRVLAAIQYLENGLSQLLGCSLYIVDSFCVIHNFELLTLYTHHYRMSSFLSTPDAMARSMVC